MTDRPILFSAPMVRALLEGRKTQTRRVLKPPYGTLQFTPGRGDNAYTPIHTKHFVGDRLWVREHHARTEFNPHFNMPYAPTHYYADGPLSLDLRHDAGLLRSHPGIHMPRWASRLTLTVTDVRAQRLQDISDDDAIAEGVLLADAGGVPCWRGYDKAPVTPSAAVAFRYLWESIHGPDAWGKNPWVAALTFTVTKANIDAVR